MKFKEKLKELIDRKGITMYRVSIDTGIPKQSIMRYVNGTVKPNGDNLHLLAKYFNVSVDSLVDEASDIKQQKAEQPKEENAPISTPHYETRKTYAIPHIEEHAASCGIPNGFSVAIKREDCESYIIPDMPNCDFTIRTRGRSMVNRNCPERNINERDIVACKIWTSRTHLRWGEVYALATNDGIVVKQIQESEKDGYVKCVSFNEEEGFKPYDLPVEEITDWAIVVGVISVKTWN